LVIEADKSAVALSEQNGVWYFMDDVGVLIKPDDYIKYMQANGNAINNFDTFDKVSQRFMLRIIKIAKTEATRAKRILEISALAKDNIKLLGS
jgi:uncharacterized protein YdeI (YjbR/CyaY-like superfamily)